MLRLWVVSAMACGGGKAPADAHPAVAVPPEAGTAAPAPAVSDAGGPPARDAALPDASRGDAPASDAGRAWQMQEQDLSDFEGPQWLSETGLFADIASGELATTVRPYAPLGELWADGASKRRFLQLPQGAHIDTRDMDQWVFPIGTRVFKEFAVAGAPIETRMLEKRAEGDWLMIAYQWDRDRSDARAVPLGVVDAGGTWHDIPDREACKQCHAGRSDTVLGATALQLSHDGEGVTLATLSAEGRLSDPPPTALVLPGDEIASGALAYLHANCGHCHNPQRVRADREISVYFWQEADALGRLEDTVTYRSLVTDKALPLWIDAVLDRMADRGGIQQMPPLATEQVDAEGMAGVAALMQRLRAGFAADVLVPQGGSGPCPDVEPVFDIFERAACRSAFCHGSGTGELDFRTPADLHESLVGVEAIGEGCEEIGLRRVAPGDPARSLLMLKLRPGPPCGKIMPPAMSLSEAELQVVEDWIAGCQ